jgi:cell division GTPase FtsZ
LVSRELKISEEQMATFIRIESKSGNRTVLIIVDPPFIDGSESEQLIRGLVSLGCTFEGANRVLFSISVPSDVDLDEIRQYLIDHGAQWEHADPT